MGQRHKCYLLWMKDTTQAKQQPPPHNTVHICIVNEILFWEGFLCIWSYLFETPVTILFLQKCLNNIKVLFLKFISNLTLKFIQYIFTKCLLCAGQCVRRNEMVIKVLAFCSWI